MPRTRPCSPYDPAAGARGFVLPPRYHETPPYYHTVADLPLLINPSSELETLAVSPLCFLHISCFYHERNNV